MLTATLYISLLPSTFT